MRVLVTGADGLLGSNLVRLLITRGYDVSVFLHPSSRSTTLDGLEIQKHFGDILEPESLENAMTQIDAVVHAAANTSIWPARSENVRMVNIQGTQNVINLVLKYNISRMIYIGSASSVNTVGASNVNSYPGAKFGLDYIDSKYEALNLILDAVKTKELPALAILPTFMIGPYDSSPSSGKMIIAVAKRKLKFYTGGGRNFVSVKDVSSAIVNSLEIQNIGKYYITGNENISYRTFFKKIATVVEQPAPQIKIPNWSIKILGYMGNLFGYLLKKQPLISYPVACISCENQFASSEDAKNELKMPQTPIEVAIEECYEWFKTKGYC